MNTSIKGFSQGLLTIAILALIILQACQEENKTILPATIQFGSVQNVTEGDEATITLLLDRAAPSNGTISITIETNAISNQHYFTDPAINNGSLLLIIEKGQKSAEFKVTTIDNTTFDNGKYMIFKLISPSEGFKLGVVTTYALTIGDDEGPSQANFATNKGTVNENISEGIVVDIPLSSPAKGEGSITITVDPGLAVYGTNYTTTPAVINNSITFTVAQNETSASFTVLPVNDNLFTDNLALSFSIAKVSGVLQKGNILNYFLTIDDDEEPSIANFELNAGTIDEKESKGMLVQILLSTPAKGTGNMTITFNRANAVYGKDFMTSPAASGGAITLNILPNETSASFAVLPVHNYIATQNLQIAFSISTVSGVVRKGTSLAYSLTIINEDQQSVVNFATNSGALNENNVQGIVVEIPFSAQAPAEGSITISFTPSVNTSYGNHFTTIPAAAVNNTITLNVAANQPNASFKVLPVNNAFCSSSEQSIQWTISLVIGSLKKGSDLDYKLTLNDDDEVSILTFAENSGTVSENNASGIVVHLNFSKPIQEYIGINVGTSDNWSGYGSAYVTNPEYYCDYSYCGLYLSIAKDASTAVFTVLPVNNTTVNGDYKNEFFIYSYSNSGCLTAAPNAKFALTIVDDE